MGLKAVGLAEITSGMHVNKGKKPEDRHGTEVRKIRKIHQR